MLVIVINSNLIQIGNMKTENYAGFEIRTVSKKDASVAKTPGKYKSQQESVVEMKLLTKWITRWILMEIPDKAKAEKI